MTNDNLLPVSFPAIRAKKVTAAFDGGRLTSDGGVMLLAMAERRLGVADRLARSFPDRRDPTRILHTRADMIRAHIHAIACGYEDADDLDFLRTDPAFKLACGRLPETGGDLCSQPTLSRMENAPSLKDAIRLTYALVDQWMASYERAPAIVILDLDDTCDVAHGHQQLSLFNAHYDERCFLPIRPGKTPGGVEVRAHLRRLVRHIRKCWPKRASPSGAMVDAKADEVRVERAMENRQVVRSYAETGHKAKSWTRERRAVARIEATPLGLDIRFVVTDLEYGSAEWLYESLYCARGQAENLIKLHKTQLSSDRTSCRSAVANQVRLVLHTAAYWLMLTVRDAIPQQRDLAKAEFATLRLRLLKIAARVIETARTVRRRSSRGGPLRQLAWRARPARPLTDGASAPSPVLLLQRVIKMRSIRR